MNASTTLAGATRLACGACAALLLLAAGAAVARGPAVAAASTPTAIQLADRALTAPDMLADESPYELIDPVGPGGITQDKAVGEVSASIMIGGLYDDANHSYGGGTYFAPHRYLR